MDLSSMEEGVVLDNTAFSYISVLEEPTEKYYDIEYLENIIFKSENKEYTINFKKFLKDYGVESNE